MDIELLVVIAIIVLIHHQQPPVEIYLGKKKTERGVTRIRVSPDVVILSIALIFVAIVKYGPAILLWLQQFTAR